MAVHLLPELGKSFPQAHLDSVQHTHFHGQLQENVLPLEQEPAEFCINSAALLLKVHWCPKSTHRKTVAGLLHSESEKQKISSVIHMPSLGQEEIQDIVNCKTKST